MAITDSHSLSDLQIHDDTTVSEELTQSFYLDFFGFSSEEWSRTTSYDTSPENVNFGGKLDSSKPSISNGEVSKPNTKVEETNPIFRSSSGSFRYMRRKTVSTPSTSRSMSVTVMERSKVASKSKSRWQVFMFGFGSGKFPTKMDLSDLKSRQLRHESTTRMDFSDMTKSREPHDQSVGQRSEKKAWWRLVDILGCGGGYERDAVVAF
ncbi:hypothetical protein L2E82_32382 [Cichorium intybus]|uniref:Uncharacterized protein n=1 Tax=Cichorium intybus TaxID=13427 RepID=A0ACB9BFU4_CICIN|nr:hypothetical protein L2E82_32382 [Cichorium intybus]